MIPFTMKSLFSRKLLIFAAVFLGFLPVSAQSALVTITTNQALNFGTFVVGNFNSVLTVTILDNGSTTTSGGISILSAPTRGEYTLDAGVASAGTVYTITPSASVNLTGPGNTLVVDNFTITPAVLQFDGSGMDDINIGARLSTPGDGNGFNGGSYSGTLSLNVAF
jgi:hypothetical protein